LAAASIFAGLPFVLLERLNSPFERGVILTIRPFGAVLGSRTTLELKLFFD